MATALTTVNEQLLHGSSAPSFGLPGSYDWHDGHRQQVTDTARHLFGDTVRISDRVGLSDVESYHGTPHSMTGIPYVAPLFSINPHLVDTHR